MATHCGTFPIFSRTSRARCLTQYNRAVVGVGTRLSSKQMGMTQTRMKLTVTSFLSEDAGVGFACIRESRPLLWSWGQYSYMYILAALKVSKKVEGVLVVPWD